MEDQRFTHIAKDPRFRKPKRENRKVKIDDRFSQMFKDDNFKTKCTVDKRGRPIKATSNENLKRYYDLESSESSDDDDSDDGSIDDNDSGESEGDDHMNKPLEVDARFAVSGAKAQDFVSDENDDSPDEDEDEASDSDNQIDFARGEGVMASSSEEDSSDDDDDDDNADKSQDDNVDHKWGEIDKEAPVAEEITSRLALCNMVWDRITAKDILVILNSFKPVGGIIRSVKIYPSEFGLQRMKEEELSGPTELLQANRKQKKKQRKRNLDEEEADDGAEFETEKLREYQLKRMKYFYAVIECDNTSTANHIYEQCDGLEFETSANKLDLRFIPDDMEFEHEPKSVATESAELASYKPSTYISSALQQSTVGCTWDEDDTRRMQVTRRKIKEDELDQLNLDDYLASGSDSDADPYGDVEEPSFAQPNAPESGSENEGDSIEKYRNLMNLIVDKEKQTKKKEPEMEMEITWELGKKEAAEKLVEKKVDEKELTPWDQYLKKKKDKRKQKKLERAQERSKNDKDGDDLLDDDDIPSDVDMNDAYFRDALQDSDDENDYPSDNTKLKKPKKKKKSKEKKPDEDEEAEKHDPELDLLTMDDELKQHYSLKKLVVPQRESKTQRKKRLKREAEAKKKGLQQQDTFQLDVEDDRFKALYENPHFNIDPSAPEYKSTENMKLLVDAKVKKSHKRQNKSQDSSQQTVKQQTLPSNETVPQAEPSMDSLIKSVKSKAINFGKVKKNRHKKLKLST